MAALTEKELIARIKSNKELVKNVKSNLTTTTATRRAAGMLTPNAIQQAKAKLQAKIDADQKALDAITSAKAKTQAARNMANGQVPTDVTKMTGYTPAVASMISSYNKVNPQAPITTAEQAQSYFGPLGGGMGTLVYMGGTVTSAVGSTDMARAGVKGMTMINVKSKNDILQSFTTDKNVQTKVMAAMRNAGIKNVNQYTAFIQWSDIVDKAAVAYSSGLKLTPMDLLNMTLNGSGNKSQASDITSTYYTTQNPATIAKTVNDSLIATLGRGIESFTPEEKKVFIDAVTKMANVGTKVRTVRNAKGELVKQVQGAGYDTQAGLDAVAKMAKENPKYAEDLKAKQGQNLFDWMQGLDSVRGGS